MVKLKYVKQEVLQTIESVAEKHQSCTEVGCRHHKSAANKSQRRRCTVSTTPTQRSCVQGSEYL